MIQRQFQSVKVCRLFGSTIDLPLVPSLDNFFLCNLLWCEAASRLDFGMRFGCGVGLAFCCVFLFAVQEILISFSLLSFHAVDGQCHALVRQCRKKKNTVVRAVEDTTRRFDAVIDRGHIDSVKNTGHCDHLYRQEGHFKVL